MITNFKIYESRQKIEYGIIGLDAIYDIALKKVKILKHYNFDPWSIPEIEVQFLDGTILL